MLDRLITNAGKPQEKRQRASTLPKPSHTRGCADKLSDSFNISDDDGFPRTSPERKNFARSSVDDINTSFVNDDGRTAWQFNAGGGEQTKPEPQPVGQDGQGSPTKPATMPQSEAANTQGQWTQSTDAAFNADGWNDQFGPQTFVLPLRTNSSASPSKASRTNSRKPKATKPVPGESAQNAVLVDGSSDEETFTWRGRNGRAASPQAMDIDSPPVEPAPENSDPQSNGARNIRVEPSRPEWRSGNFAGVDGSKNKVPEQKQPVNPNAGGSEDTEEFKASFADLRNVAPFASQGAGLKSFTDLKDNLPFESRPSDEIPIEQKVSAPQPLSFPDPPQAPRPPLTMGVPNMQTNLPTWEKYVQEFEDYMRRWDTFTGQVTDHFRERRVQVSDLRKAKGYGFLRARGDAEYLEYFRTVQQDNDVRRRWNAACDEHEQRLREFMACREKMK